MRRAGGHAVVSAFADEYSSVFEEQCAAMRRLGVGWIELRGADGKNVGSMTEEDTDRIGGLLGSYGVKVSSIGSPLGKIKITSPEEELEEHMKKAERVFGTAVKLGARYVRVFSFYIPRGEDRGPYRESVLKYMRRMADAAGRRGLLLCHENEAGIYGESPEECEELLSELDGQIRAVFDMGNFVLCGHDPLKGYGLLKDRIEYFHIKDAMYSGAVVPPGKGEAGIEEILGDFSSGVSSDYFVSLEPHLQTFSGRNALSGLKFDNPYIFSGCAEAFETALRCLREIIQKCENS